MFKAKLNKNKKSFLFIITSLIVLILVTLGSWLVYNNYQLRTLKPQLPAIEQKGVTYIINKGEGNIKEYEIEISNVSTVFSLLEELSKKEGFKTETTVYPEMGIFVKSIDDLEGGTDNKWWQYWVNDNLSEVAADKKEVNNGDTVEWRFELVSF